MTFWPECQKSKTPLRMYLYRKTLIFRVNTQGLFIGTLGSKIFRKLQFGKKKKT